MSTIVVTATWDSEASVWVAESEQLPIITEAPSLDALVAKLPGIIQDLLEEPDLLEAAIGPHGELMQRLRRLAKPEQEHVPFELVARFPNGAPVSPNFDARRGSAS
jgi:hypothetical protein